MHADVRAGTLVRDGNARLTLLRDRGGWRDRGGRPREAEGRDARGDRQQHCDHQPGRYAWARDCAWARDPVRHHDVMRCISSSADWKAVGLTAMPPLNT